MAAASPPPEAWASVDDLADWFQQFHEVSERGRAVTMSAMMFAANQLTDEGMAEMDRDVLIARKNVVLRQSGYPGLATDA